MKIAELCKNECIYLVIIYVSAKQKCVPLIVTFCCSILIIEYVDCFKEEKAEALAYVWFVWQLITFRWHIRATMLCQKIPNQTLNVASKQKKFHSFANQK